ncbi:MAG: anthranilate synthase component I family protein [Planctomycetes bacterium]|nr:anthranilate synthase component I family protein [Planctomycetota bacterium]
MAVVVSSSLDEPIRRACGCAATRPLAILSSGGGGPHARTSTLVEVEQTVHAATGMGERLLNTLQVSERREGGGWIASLSYGLGATIEPTARAAGVRHESPFGDGTMLRARCVHAFDHEQRAWTSPGLPPIAELPATRAGTLEPQTSDADYAAAILRVRELIRAGDIFQANIARAWMGFVPMPMRAWALGVLDRIPARYGAYAELGSGRAVLSVSPELFLSVDACTRTVRTRPIKGTRASDGCAHELERCDKERAELHMIVDLMRNDLGRVCSIGSVRVSEPRSIERHPTVQHAVAEVSGTLRPGIGHAELLRATFPPGSVTGAPKVRAMQIIDELEPFERGPYCGALGWLGDDGAVVLNVAIRTFALQEVKGGTQLMYWTGCGIVADSDPTRECRESHEKAAVALLAVGTRRLPGDPSHR